MPIWTNPSSKLAQNIMKRLQPLRLIFIWEDYKKTSKSVNILIVYLLLNLYVLYLYVWKVVC